MSIHELFKEWNLIASGETTKVGSNKDVVNEYYKKFAPNYNKDFIKKGKYQAPKILVDYVKSLSFDKDSKIIDLLGGTGIIGKLLNENGFLNLDILDSCEEMLDESKKLDVYKNYIVAFLDKNNKSPCSDDYYDLAVLSGGIAPGHASSEIFDEVTRIIKPGGYFIWTMREKHIEETKSLTTIFEDVERQILDGKWNQIARFSFNYYVLEDPGLLFAMQIQ